MPFEFKQAANFITNKFKDNKILGLFVRNPFYTALLISIIIVLVILFVFRNVDFEDEEEGLSKLSIRSGIYLLIIITAVQFFQNQALLGEFQRGAENKQLDTVFDTDKTVSNRIQSVEGGSQGQPKESAQYVPVGIDVSFV